MMSVLPNGGCQAISLLASSGSAALDDVSATEWRRPVRHTQLPIHHAALDDVSATEWRPSLAPPANPLHLLHSMMSVLPNGGLSAA